MTIASSIADALIAIGASITETIYYTASGESEATLTGHVFRDMPDSSGSALPRGGVTMLQTRDIYIRSSDISDVSLNADTCRIKWHADSSSYTACTVKSIVKQDAGSWTLRVIRGT